MDIFKIFEAAQPVNRSEKQISDFADLEAKINQVCRAAGIDPVKIETRVSDTSPLPQPVMELIHGRQKIQAIKLYRELTGTGLKEAKDAIDAAEAGDPFHHLPRFPILHAKLDAVLAKLEAER